MTTLEPGVSLAVVEDGSVLLDERSGRYWQLNLAGTFILMRSLDGTEKIDIARQLSRKWNVATDNAMRDLQSLLVDLKQKELIR